MTEKKLKEKITVNMKSIDNNKKLCVYVYLHRKDHER